jgi:hypothetical protein
MNGINQAMDILHKRMVAYYKSNFSVGKDEADAMYL